MLAIWAFRRLYCQAIVCDLESEEGVKVREIHFPVLAAVVEDQLVSELGTSWSQREESVGLGERSQLNLYPGTSWSRRRHSNIHPPEKKVSSQMKG